MADRYFVISTSCDGASVEGMDKATLLKRLGEGYWGRDCPRPQHPVHKNGSVDLTAEEGFTIIKGEVVTPVAVEVVKKFDIP